MSIPNLQLPRHSQPSDSEDLWEWEVGSYRGRVRQGLLRTEDAEDNPR